MAVSKDNKPSDETQPLRAKYRVGRDYKNQKSPAGGNNVRKSVQHKGDRWKTIKGASHSGTGGNSI